jgi:hypothetical protein
MAFLLNNLKQGFHRFTWKIKGIFDHITLKFRRFGPYKRLE